jgi:putative flavoprotein involved in K+ transport
MSSIDTVVVGAGHAGLAVSRLLTEASCDHIVIERGRVGERWRTERWDSLHLLTPNWMTRLPGWYPNGRDPEGYMSAGRFVGHLERYADSFDAPVIDGTTVEEVSAVGGLDELDHQYLVVTDKGTWRARHIVIATGPHGVPCVPPGLERVEVVTSNHYRNPDQLTPGGVLVVGASSTGVQIADELLRSGREVYLAVGRHTRMPRRYRGMDIFWWLQGTGRLARTIDEMPDRSAARGEPYLQMVGRMDPAECAQDLDLAALQARGVRLLGRFDGLDGGRARFRSDLAENVAAADRKMHRFLDTVDTYVESTGLTDEVWPGVRPRPLDVPRPVRWLDFARQGISTVVVAAGYRPHHPWLRLPITASDGRIRQYQRVTPAPGVYVVGQRFQHRRDSGFIDGARHDARAVVRHLRYGPAEASDDRSEEPAA